MWKTLISEALCFAHPKKILFRIWTTVFLLSLLITQKSSFSGSPGRISFSTPITPYTKTFCSSDTEDNFQSGPGVPGEQFAYSTFPSNNAGNGICIPGQTCLRFFDITSEYPDCNLIPDTSHPHKYPVSS